MIKKNSQRKRIIAVTVIILLVIGVAIGVSVASRKPVSKINLSSAMTSLQKQYHTVKQTYVYSESRDPNGNLGKPGYYTTGAEFYDTRTCLPKADFGCTGSYNCTGAFDTDCGGSIEVYPNASDASKRVTYLKGFQGQGFLDPGAIKQVNNVVIRASRFYPASEQTQIINYISDLIKQ